MNKKELIKKIQKVEEKIEEYEIFDEEVEDEFDKFLGKGLAEKMKDNDMEKYQKELELFAKTLDKANTKGYNDLLDELDDLEYELEFGGE